MVDKLPIFNARFWKILKYLDNLNDVISLSDLKLDLAMPDLFDSELVEVINFLQKFSYDVRLIVNNENVYIHPFEDNEGVQIRLSFSEWIALQTHFPLFQNNSTHGLGDDLMSKMQETNNKYPGYDLFNQVENEDDKNVIINLFHNNESNIISLIEASITNSTLLNVETMAGQRIIYPQRLVYLEKKLTLICENIVDKKLESTTINEIRNLNVKIDQSYNANFTSLEINDFIYALRAVNGDEERLILKVISNENLNFKPPFQFLGTPYKTSNMNGDIIWAASVEVSDPLMEWIYQLKNNIEIIDPIHIKEKFDQYCQRREDAKKYKKVS